MVIKEALPIGTILDSGVRKYEIKSVLGKGGFGITYLATSTIQVGNISAVMQFAIKEHYISTMNERQGLSVSISNPNNTDEVKESIDGFMVEAQRLNKLSLNHPGIVSVNESFRANGTAYYVMEYVKGQSLREYVKQTSQSRLSEDEALKLFQPIKDSLGYLHENRVTHLDIKPDNILIRENGAPVIVDFGLSKHYSSKGTPTSTIKAAGCSTGYSPMEQYVGITTFTPEADIYALGATLLYMLTGKDPMISTEINKDVIRKSIPQGISQTTIDSIVHAMEKLKENRTHKIVDFWAGTELQMVEEPIGRNEINKTNIIGKVEKISGTGVSSSEQKKTIRELETVRVCETGNSSFGLEKDVRNYWKLGICYGVFIIMMIIITCCWENAFYKEVGFFTDAREISIYILLAPFLEDTLARLIPFLLLSIGLAYAWQNRWRTALGGIFVLIILCFQILYGYIYVFFADFYGINLDCYTAWSLGYYAFADPFVAQSGKGIILSVTYGVTLFLTFQLLLRNQRQNPLYKTIVFANLMALLVTIVSHLSINLYFVLKLTE